MKTAITAIVLTLLSLPAMAQAEGRSQSPVRKQSSQVCDRDGCYTPSSNGESPSGRRRLRLSQTDSALVNSNVAQDKATLCSTQQRMIQKARRKGEEYRLVSVSSVEPQRERGARLKVELAGLEDDDRRAFELFLVSVSDLSASAGERVIVRAINYHNRPRVSVFSVDGFERRCDGVLR